MRMLKSAILLIVVLAAGATAWAQADLAAAKTSGLVGERPDGLVGLVDETASAEVRQMVERVNAERMAEYREIAQSTDVPIAAVQARAGRQIIQRLPAGQYFMDAAGRWRKK